MSQNTTIPVKVGVVLDLDAWVGKMGLSCISMALSDFYASHGHYKTRVDTKIRDSKGDVFGAAAAAVDLVQKEEVEAIIGPRSSMQANFMSDLGSKAWVPIISFSATSPSLSSLQSRYFIRATLNDSAQVPAIRAIVQAFGWREVVLIYVDNEYGNGVVPSLTSALQEVDTHVTYRSAIHPSATDDQIVKELYKLMTMSTRVFIVHMLTPLGSQLFTKAKKAGMMEKGYVWILTDGITDTLSALDASAIDSMQGVLGVKPHVRRTKELESFRIRWKKKIQEEYPTNEISELNIFGLWAYDAACALAMAVEKLGAGNFSLQKTNISRDSTGFESIRVSPVGPNILHSLLSTRFRGLSGDFQIFDGQLHSTAFQIVNVIGKGERGVGFWTPKNGIIRRLNFTNTNSNTYSTSKDNLGIIVWPGEPTYVPKGWVLPVNEKKLRIGVPVKNGFSEFVNVTWDPKTNAPKVTGYCIDVFDAVMDSLPYAVPREYIPFGTPDGKSAGSYNDLIYQVFLKNYDAVVGDTTIVANRTYYVDFTLPYTESGVSMIVPIKDNKSKSAWIFLKPLTWDLWVTSACFFVFIGFVIWVLEHRINEDFRGPHSHQAGTIFWFSFSTMVFAQKERIVSNLARFVMIIWFFVLLILTQSYTASLTSMLTVQQLQPTVTDIKELQAKGEYVGYQQDSFVLEFLKRMKFDESKVRIYNSSEKLAELLSKGSANGGIAAAFDEIPYMKLFIAQHCSKYTMVQPTYKFDGFGFAFPIGSPLVPDVSRAILIVTESNEMVKIEKKWFREKTSCSDDNGSSLSSNNISLDSFWGLFLIAGVTSSLALIIGIAMFLHKHRVVVMGEDSAWTKIKTLMTLFDQKDLSSHTFRIPDQPYSGSNEPMAAVGASPSVTNCSPRPSTFSNQTNNDIPLSGEQGTSSSEHGGWSSITAGGQSSPEIVAANLNQERTNIPETSH
ncbi:hypothetical protein PVL29_004542 [Vitis rotundifolia]|uniref:Glutamate receptor n=1 Tax=Vitis rotundifolia TaxID=103349 RepID=A0AA39A8A7_VITRO|nr:hypothetical protein PVL29_004542 [Vitis rotundifolia]